MAPCVLDSRWRQLEEGESRTNERGSPEPSRCRLLGLALPARWPGQPSSAKRPSMAAEVVS